MKLVTVNDLAQSLGIHRSCLHRKVKRDCLARTTVHRLTSQGTVQAQIAVPVEYAEGLQRFYREAGKEVGPLPG